MCQRRPADPTDPGDAADLSIMGYRQTLRTKAPRFRPVFYEKTIAQEQLKINTFLTNARESQGLR